MYETFHTRWQRAEGRIDYTVWSDVFSCANCGKEIVFVNEAYDKTSGQFGRHSLVRIVE